MADIGASNWNEADASNSTAAPDGAPEGMAPSGVNDTLRAMMGATKRFYDWNIPLLTGGTSTAYTLAYSVAPVLVDGMTHLVRFHTANGTTATLNVNGLGAKPLYAYGGSWGQAPIGMLATDQVVRVAYNSAAGAYFLLDLLYSSKQTVSGAATIDFIAIPAAVNNVVLDFELVPSTNAVTLAVQTYKAGVLSTGGSDYAYAINAVGSNASAVQSGSAASGTMNINNTANVVSNSGAAGISGRILFENIQNTTNTKASWTATYLDSAGAVLINAAGGGWRADPNPITGVRLFFGSGNLTGSATLRIVP